MEAPLPFWLGAGSGKFGGWEARGEEQTAAKGRVEEIEEGAPQLSRHVREPSLVDVDVVAAAGPSVFRPLPTPSPDSARG